MALGRHFRDQLRRLRLPIRSGQKVLFGVTLTEKDGKWGYRVIRKSHSDWNIPQWKGTTTSVDIQIYETPSHRFKSAEAALESAEKWLEQYRESTRAVADAVPEPETAEPEPETEAAEEEE